MYANVGPCAPHNKTKKAFRDAVAAGKAEVFSTSLSGPVFDGMVVDLPRDVKLSVVGPDPERQRSWYATVAWRNGKLTVT